jgi:hypothetical protein
MAYETQTHRRRILTILIAITALLYLGMPDAWAAAGKKGKWKRLRTRLTIIHYHNVQDLFQFNEKIAYFPGDLGVKSLYAPKDAKGIQGILTKKVDALFQRAQQILDMPKRVARVNIRVYPSRKTLHAEFERLFKEPCQLRAWYLFEKKGIYLDVEDVHEGILAHEMGHHIIDHFFKARPPSATAEILARFIDANLFGQ